MQSGHVIYIQQSYCKLREENTCAQRRLGARHYFVRFYIIVITTIIILLFSSPAHQLYSQMKTQSNL